MAVRVPLPEDSALVSVPESCIGDAGPFESEYGVESDEPQEFLSFKGEAPLCAVQKEKCERKRMIKNHSASYYRHKSCKNSLEWDYERGICNVPLFYDVTRRD